MAKSRTKKNAGVADGPQEYIKGAGLAFSSRPRQHQTMPRHPRVHLDGLTLHIVQRGHNREPCFFAEEDDQSYLHGLGEALGEAECKLHADVLMTRHGQCPKPC